MKCIPKVLVASVRVDHDNSIVNRSRERSVLANKQRMLPVIRSLVERIDPSDPDIILDARTTDAHDWTKSFFRRSHEFPFRLFIDENGPRHVSLIADCKIIRQLDDPVFTWKFRQESNWLVGSQSLVLFQDDFGTWYCPKRLHNSLPYL